jgi:hypothetical protein
MSNSVWDSMGVYFSAASRATSDGWRGVRMPAEAEAGSFGPMGHGYPDLSA